jgi:hypothetical protein
MLPKDSPGNSFKISSNQYNLDRIQYKFVTCSQLSSDLNLGSKSKP